MKKIILFTIVSTICFSSFALEYPPHIVEWAENYVANIDLLAEEQKQKIYYMVNAFYFRLSNWEKYKPFYDQLYQDPEYAKKYPVFIDVSKGLYIVIFQHPKTIIDFPPYQSLKGQTVEQVFGYPGDNRMMGSPSIATESTRQTLIIEEHALLSPCVTGVYSSFYFSFASFFHLTLLSEEEFRHLEELYKSAGEEGHYFDDFAAINSGTYFSSGFEAYFSVSKKEETDVYAKYTRKDLEKKDPKLLKFIESLIDDHISLENLENSELTCYNF